MGKTKLIKGKKLVKKSTVGSSTPRIEKKIKRKNKKTKPLTASPDSESDTADPQAKIQTLLEPFSKDQLITLVADLSLSNTTLFSLVKSAADKDVSHRKVFVHGLGWDATRDSVQSIFAAYGELEDINVITDRATGKCKGYAFITYKSRKSARNLLKNPKVNVGNRVTSCQLASAGPVAPGTVSSEQQHFPSNSSDFPQRKIYVNNVPVGANPGKLRSFFEKFGEIENGPMGLDPNTGRFRGYAIFVFKTVEGAKNVLEDPYKVFEGSQLHCQKAAEGKSKLAGGQASITTALLPVQPQMLAAVAAAQQTGLVNSLYGGGMIPNANPGALMGGYYGMMGSQLQGFGLGAYGVTGSGASSGGSSGSMFQGLQYMYPSTLTGQTPSLPKTSGTSGSGYSSR